MKWKITEYMGKINKISQRIKYKWLISKQKGKCELKPS